MSENKEISIHDILNMKEEDFHTLFSSQESLVVVPPKGYKIDWDRIKEPTDCVKLVRFVFETMFNQSVIFIDSADLTVCPIKEFLVEVDT